MAARGRASAPRAVRPITGYLRPSARRNTRRSFTESPASCPSKAGVLPGFIITKVGGVHREWIKRNSEVKD